MKPMKTATVAALFVLAALAYAPAASACAMFRPERRVRPERMVAQAQQAEKAGRERAAIRLYERVLNQGHAPAKLRAKAGFNAARLLEKTGRTALARARLLRVVALRKHHGRAQLALGRLFAGQDDAQSIHALNAALKERLTRTDEAQAEALMAQGLARQAKLEAAERHLRRARALGAEAAQVAAAEKAIRDAKGHDAPPAQAAIAQG